MHNESEVTAGTCLSVSINVADDNDLKTDTAWGILCNKESEITPDLDDDTARAYKHFKCELN